MTEHRLIYLASPIDLADHLGQGVASSWRTRARLALTGAGLGVYDPQAAFLVGDLTPGEEIAKVNHRAQSLCTGMLALLPSGVLTYGVPVDLDRMVRGRGKPVAIVTNEPRSWIIAGWCGLGDRVQCFRQVEDAVSWLVSTEAPELGAWPQPLPFATATEGAAGFTEGQRLPARAFKDDAGLDLFVSEETLVGAGRWADVPTGVRVALDTSTYGLVIGRSSTLRTRGLMVQIGVIDPGWRGELFVQCWNMTDRDVVVSAGDRVGQLLIMPNEGRRYLPFESGSLPPSDRGFGGFGSTGR